MVTTEVDEEEVDERSRRKKGARASARNFPPKDVPQDVEVLFGEVVVPVEEHADEVAILREKAMQPGTFPSVAAKLLKRADALERKELIERLLDDPDDFPDADPDDPLRGYF